MMTGILWRSVELLSDLRVHMMIYQEKETVLIFLKQGHFGIL